MFLHSKHSAVYSLLTICFISALQFVVSPDFSVLSLAIISLLKKKVVLAQNVHWCDQYANIVLPNYVHINILHGIVRYFKENHGSSMVDIKTTTLYYHGVNPCLEV